MEMQNNPLWKKGTFSKQGFLLRTTQKPFFFPYRKWLIFPVPHQTDPDSDVTPLPQRDRKNIHNVERVIFYFLHVCFQPR